MATIFGATGTDTLLDIERIVFADPMLSFGVRAEALARVAFALWNAAIVGSATLSGMRDAGLVSDHFVPGFGTLFQLLPEG